jgi:hypothetical protein
MYPDAGGGGGYDMYPEAPGPDAGAAPGPSMPGGGADMYPDAGEMYPEAGAMYPEAGGMYPDADDAYPEAPAEEKWDLNAALARSQAEAEAEAEAARRGDGFDPRRLMAQNRRQLSIEERQKMEQKMKAKLAGETGYGDDHLSSGKDLSGGAGGETGFTVVDSESDDEMDPFDRYQQQKAEAAAAAHAAGLDVDGGKKKKKRRRKGKPKEGEEDDDEEGTAAARKAAKANSEYQKTMAFMETHERDQLGKKKEEGNSNQPRGEGERRKKRRVT